jgi:heme-degrading monooxygenase HmoA
VPRNREVKEEIVMVARVWKGLTPVTKAAQYLEYLRRTGVEECLATNGNRGVLVLQQATAEGTAEFLFVSLWESMDSIRGFAGDEIEKAVYYPEDHEFLLAMEPRVLHYDVAEFGIREKSHGR